MTTRLPFTPLEQFLQPHLLEHLDPPHPDNTVGPVTCLADRLACNPRQIHRWRHQGLTIQRADQLATRLGRHPSDIWGPNWDHTDSDDLEEAL